MSTTKAWGRIGAWAAEAEAAEAEEKASAAAAAAGGGGADVESFPSLKEAASAKGKKKKPAAMSLNEFFSASSSAKGLTQEELLRLPTGPRERSQEELEAGRGFRSYGGGMSGRRDDGGGGRRGYGGFEDEPARRGPPRGSDYEPSRADEVDNWGSMKKNIAPSSERFEGLGGRMGGSRADETDNWAAGKRQMAPPPRQSTFGSGPSDSDRWARGSVSQFPRNGDRERPRLVLEPRKADLPELAPVETSRTTKSNPFGAARPREEVLAEKGMDWRRLEAEIETKKTSRPTSSHSSRPSSAHSSRAQSPPRQLGGADAVVKIKPKVNPFGEAKPREIVLQEKGQDWKKIDFELEHRGVDRPDTDEEKNMKEEINTLNELLTKDTKHSENGEHDRFTPEELDNLQQKKEILERELEQLARELDDKVRFGQRRPGSGSGRVSSQPVSEDARSTGGSDTWSRSGEDRRTYNLGAGSGFLGNRNAERVQSRDRW